MGSGLGDFLRKNIMESRFWGFSEREHCRSRFWGLFLRDKKHWFRTLGPSDSLGEKSHHVSKFNWIHKV